MAVCIRAKRVTGPLDDSAKARLRGEFGHRTAGYYSSGSDHDPPTCLSGLVHAFLETSGDAGEPLLDSESAKCSDEGEDLDRDRAAEEVIRELMHSVADDGDHFRLRLAADVSSAKESLAALGVPAVALRRAVMARLRAAGYNAGICKARWETAGGLTAGSYEYLDVVAPSEEGETEGARYIVDLEFAAEFEVARATEGYRRVAAALPRVAVARPDAVRQVVRAVADAARRSLRSRGLHVPPWRKSRYMQAKWLGPYRRTTNALPASAGSTVGDVKCLSIGFSAPAANRPGCGEISLF